MNDQEIKFEEWNAKKDDLHLSPSALKLLKNNPAIYHKHYILDEKVKLTGKHFDEGSLIHCMVLEPDEVKNKFINMAIPVPSETILSCINYVLELCPQDSSFNYYDKEILNHLITINKHQSLKDTKDGTGDSKRLNKILTENAEEYFRLHVENKDKVIVDQESWDKCKYKAEAILANKQSNYLLKAINDDDEVRTELELSTRPDEFQFGIKGILDCIKVDRKEKTIYVSDIKTTSGTISQFKDVVDKYDYWLQPPCYQVLAKSLMRGIAYDYKFEFHFIVVDKNNQVYNFLVSETSLEKWTEQLIQLVNFELTWHIDNKDFDLPYEFAKNSVVL